MAFAFQAHYPPDVAARVRAFYTTLSEKDRRRYAAVEARRLGHGGIEYVAEVLECSRRTIERGLNELDELPHDTAAGRVRRPGGGRKKKVATEPQLEHHLQSVLEVRTAGDPDTEEVVWTDLSPRQIAAVVTALGTPVSPPVVRDWLEEQGLALHKIAKVLEGGAHPDRDAQFQRITELKTEYLDAGNPRPFRGYQGERAPRPTVSEGPRADAASLPGLRP